MPGAPRSIRFDEDVDRRLRAYVAAHPSLSGSAAANRFVDEGLRMSEHPSIVFRDGPTGRRAVLVAGPDVWEVIRAVRSARASEPSFDAERIVRLVARNSGTPEPAVRAAIRYWSQYPDEIDDQVRLAEEAEQRAYEAWQREQGLLSA
jgi:hypothetical protein